MASGTCSPQVTDGNVGLAFGLVTAAGLSTSVGAALAFCMPYSSGGKNLFLASSLGIAAGVMIYVSFVEIFTAKSIPALADCVGEQYAYLYGTLCFFGGVFLTWAFDQGLHVLERKVGRTGKKSPTHGAGDGPPIALDALRNVVDSLAANDLAAATPDDHQLPHVAEEVGGVGVDASAHASADADADADHFVAVTRTTDTGTSAFASTTTTNTTTTTAADSQTVETAESSGASSDAAGNIRAAARREEEPIQIEHDLGHDGHMVADLYRDHAHDTKALTRMGMFAGLALAAHNFPEGLATFVAVLDDPSVGASVAVAIAIHNIPEGICVAMPIYYATGSRKKAVFWATLSGLTELIGAFLGWVVLRKVFSQVVYGVLFGIVAGMMVYISIKELLPTAHRYDPEDKVTTLSLIGGMVIMAVSLVLFLF